MINYKPLCTLRVDGKITSALAFSEAIQPIHHRMISRSAINLLENSPLSLAYENTEVDLVGVKLTELGFQGRCSSLQEIYRRALETGVLKICPPEVGPMLLMQYVDPPNNESLFIAMKPVLIDNNGNGKHCILELSRNVFKTFQLSTVYSNPEEHNIAIFWPDYYRFVFIHEPRI